MASKDKDYCGVAVRGGIVILGAQIVKVFTQLLSVTVLARLLLPEDFGMIGMLASVLAILTIIRELGIALAIVQRKEISQAHLVTLFHISLMLGVVLSALVLVFGIGLSFFVQEPRLIWITPWYSLNFVIISVGCVPLALLRRRMQFTAIAVRDASASILAIVIAIIMAMMGAGYWALVALPLIHSCTGTVLVWLAVKWKPTGTKASLQEVRPYLKFGGAFTLSEMANYFAQSTDRILIGKIWGFESLGYYSRAHALMLAPMNQVMSPVGSVMIPILSRLREDKEKYMEWILSLFKVFGFWMAILSSFLAGSAEELVLLLLGSGWSEVESIFYWLTIAVFFKPFSSVVYWLFVTSGNLKVLFRWTIINTVLIVAFVLIGVTIGTSWVALLYAVSGLILRVPIAIFLAGKTGLVKWVEILKTYVLMTLLFGFFSACYWGVNTLGCIQDMEVGLAIGVKCMIALGFVVVLFILSREFRVFTKEFTSLILKRETN